MQELRLVLIVIGALAITALVLHGLWTSRKEKPTKFKKKGSDSMSEFHQPEVVTEAIKDDILTEDFGRNGKQTRFQRTGSKLDFGRTSDMDPLDPLLNKSPEPSIVTPASDRKSTRLNSSH